MKKENLDKIRAAQRKAAEQNAKKRLGDDDAFDEIPAGSKVKLQDMSRRKGIGSEDLDAEMVGVKDKEAYQKWRRMKNLPILNEGMIIPTSDGGSANMGWLPHYFEKRTLHLPQAEQDALNVKREIYNKIHLQAVFLKHKAYGTNPVKKAQERASGRAKELGFLKAKKAQLIELFGKMFSVDEIHKIIVEEWNFPIAKADIIDFKMNNLSVISEKQEIHKREHSDLRLVHKRSRLEELTYLYNRLNDKIKVTTNREDIRVMTSILVEIRREIEGEKVTINGKLDVNIEADINTHLQKEVFKEFSLVQIIMGRVASRMRTPVYRIIQGLQNSYYARYNRFLGNEPEDVDWEEIEHPSQMGFDFEKIAAQYREKEVRYANELTAHKAKEAEIQTRVASSGIKEMLMARIAEKTGDVKAQKLQVNVLELEKKKAEASDKSGLRTKRPDQG
jgi:hypothetical protein